jgi:signal transduction histidine kinase
VTTDAGRLRQILVNLAGNAVRVTRRGGVRLVARVAGAEEGRASAGSAWLAVDVIDTGPGMTAAHQARLVGAWAPAPGGTDGSAASGAGIGLVLAAELARCLGGRLAVASAHGVGTTLTVWLPLNISPTVADTGAQERPASGRPSPELP